ncbi:TetR/AcrR family transcriptional regulator [Actinomadura kijaniata]|uniref:AcrR family transcriptional regulator n=1 Tax=Actinomadura namibiensis TaxID=182080 RepID=A0A7W3LKH5_ACTNM|nr:TetR/AcrR family transcriptional regulator [Actinomadura namibiensis]MBA8949820.1 AcrR family transcriptional regulator [Actinomadura namibiensis]
MTRGPRRAQQIFDATLELLAARGYRSLTVEGVAERAGVNKTTIYRWWPSKAALLGAALTHGTPLDLAVPDTGSLRGDLEALTRRVLDLLTRPPAADIAVAFLGAAAGEPELAGHAHAFFADRLARERAVFDRAAARGELAPGADPALLMDLLAGALWVRVVFRGLPADDDLPARLVDTVLNGASRA